MCIFFILTLYGGISISKPHRYRNMCRERGMDRENEIVNGLVQQNSLSNAATVDNSRAISSSSSCNFFFHHRRRLTLWCPLV